MRAHGAVAGENLEIIGADIHHRIDRLVGHFLRDGVDDSGDFLRSLFRVDIAGSERRAERGRKCEYARKRKAVLAFFIGMASD